MFHKYPQEFLRYHDGDGADYNTERPHSALDYQTPADYARTLTTAIARPLREMKAPRVWRLLNLRQ